MADYHTVFIPTERIYALGGPDVFKHLERKSGEVKHGDAKKNLIVVPDAFVKRLRETIDSSIGVQGTAATLEFLASITEGERHAVADHEIAVFEVSPGLDLAYVDKHAEGSPFSLTGVEKLVSKIWTSETGRTELISNKPDQLIKYRSRGLLIKSPEFLLIDKEIVDEGMLVGTDELLAQFYSKGGKATPIHVDEAEESLGRSLFLNQIVKFSGQKQQYARVEGTLGYNKERSRITTVDNIVLRLFAPDEGNSLKVNGVTRESILGIKPRDMEQYIAMQYGIFDPAIELLFLCGKQGSGKTVVAYSAIDLILDYNNGNRPYDRMIIFKANEILGGKKRDIGTVPGEAFAKLSAHLGSYADAHRKTEFSATVPFSEMFKHPTVDNGMGMRKLDYTRKQVVSGAHLPQESEAIELGLTGYMRGRSFDCVVVIADEAQNLTPYEAKTLIERCGEGTKMIFMGDPLQVDNPDCSIDLNGFTYAYHHFRNQPYVALVKLNKSQRSQMSEYARTMRVFGVQ